ncbi:MAG: protein-L-isoaspartate(D-aspartate) O-methyltransferase [Gammaproteobacteria bacterium]|nr:protein-L-isoaspartate(D-aspartate) O-methyltransferase [Gammaproteobacteria bacterium]MCP5317016.1 protein-L-isoaspartate(D-aspartate) O-methyltransferase [Chromatiaceae bacterium]MCB1818860.1 protein-L-isoaspartate(D-aspartate) O-methyltransferase [Gammaproteobacteria bacterium]MCP5428724.1 protein-L-isoaspartate(D-aspartate) O-methyltransferase [Chromatiaceae bacterium]MCP5434544.1 protein-L-isoaspartate(D-aspartate) O-methyltransferase [Chromatiaceae bacterium]
MRMIFGHLVGLLLLAAASQIICADQDVIGQAERALWGDVEFQISRLRSELGFDQLSPAVRGALHEVPRQRFVPDGQRRHAYENRPLPIGHGQTISQPLIVAIMTELLQIGPGARVFELGTGSGYQAAVLAALGAEVYSVEIIPELAERAHVTLDALNYKVATRIGDGYHGWKEAAPFDAIIVTAAVDHIPPPLIQQLKPGGRMLVPIGSRYLTQKLVLVTRDEHGAVRTQEMLPVTFVPLTGQH